MHRVELKVGGPGWGACNKLPKFLMHRVELKEEDLNNPKKIKEAFLMHRVELKGKHIRKRHHHLHCS